jgi:hypothetical protein
MSHLIETEKGWNGLGETGQGGEGINQRGKGQNRSPIEKGATERGFLDRSRVDRLFFQFVSPQSGGSIPHRPVLDKPPIRERVSRSPQQTAGKAPTGGFKAGIY